MTTVVVNVAFQFVIDVMKDKWIVKGRLHSPIHSVYALGYNYCKPKITLPYGGFLYSECNDVVVFNSNIIQSSKHIDWE